MREDCPHFHSVLDKEKVETKKAMTEDKTNSFMGR